MSTDFESEGSTKGWLKGSPSNAPGSQIAAYSYDGLNRRIRKVVTNSGSLDTDLHCYYDGPMPERPGWRWRCVEDRAVDTSQWTEALRAQYLWGGQYLDELIAFEVDVSNGSGGAPDGDFDDTEDTNAVVWHDALYSAVAVLNAKANHLGELLERYEYDPYGRATIFDSSNAPLVHSAVKLPFLFTGQRLDEETGLMYYKMRYYDAATGRFVGRDPMEYASLHCLYVYCDPTDSTDPYGQTPVGPNAPITVPPPSQEWSPEWVVEASQEKVIGQRTEEVRGYKVKAVLEPCESTPCFRVRLLARRAGRLYAIDIIQVTEQVRNSRTNEVRTRVRTKEGPPVQTWEFEAGDDSDYQVVYDTGCLPGQAAAEILWELRRYMPDKDGKAQVFLPAEEPRPWPGPAEPILPPPAPEFHFPEDDYPDPPDIPENPPRID